MKGFFGILMLGAVLFFTAPQKASAQLLTNNTSCNLTFCLTYLAPCLPGPYCFNVAAGTSFDCGPSMCGVASFTVDDGSGPQSCPFASGSVFVCGITYSYSNGGGNVTVR